MSKLRSVLAAALVGCSVLAGSAVPAAAAPAGFDLRKLPVFTLTTLFTNDGESALLGVDGDGTDEGSITDGGESPYGSVSRTATLMDDLRAQAVRGLPKRGQALLRGEITLSGGDNYLAGPEFSASTDNGVPYYDTLAAKAIGYDASAVGNHEFDFGPEVFADFVRGFDGSLPFLTSNLDVSGEKSLAGYAKDGTFVSSKVLRSSGFRVGVIGLTTPELPSLSSPRGVTVKSDLAGITNGLVRDLGKRGVNKVILVSHLQDVDNELALVPKLSGVDAVLAAGGGEILADKADRLIPGDAAERGFPLLPKDSSGKQVPVVTTTGNYKYVGRLVLNFNLFGEVIDHDEPLTGPVRVSGVGPDAVRGDPEVRASVEKPVSEHVAGLAEEVVATSEVPLDGVRNNVRSKETNLGNVVADALVHAGRQRAAEYGVPRPVVGIQNGGGMRNDSVLPAGDVSVLDTYSVAPFANYVAVVPEVSRQALRQLLERGVAATPGASGAFMQVSGLKFSYDPGRRAQVVDENTGEIRTPGERVRNVTLDDGTVLVADGVVRDGPPVPIATNDFSARGGDGYPFGGAEFTSVGTTYQGAVQQYLTDALNGRITAAQYPEGGNGRITATG